MSYPECLTARFDGSVSVRIWWFGGSSLERQWGGRSSTAV